MEQSSKNLLYVFVGLAVTISAYFGYSLLSKRKNISFGVNDNSDLKNNSTTNTKTDVDEYVSGKAKTSNEKYDLKIGMKGQKIYVLQSALKNLGCYDGVLDGEFGEKTYKAISSCSEWGWITLGSCSVLGNYSCNVDYGMWQKITNRAKQKGWNINTAWSEAKKLWK